MLINETQGGVEGTDAAAGGAVGGQETLARAIDMRQLFVLSFGAIIGVGWITVMGAWVSSAGSVGAIAAFAVGCAFMVPVALCYCEISGMFPVSGGEIAYAYKIYGLRAAYFAGWFLALHYIAVTAFEAISVAWVVDALIPGLEGPKIYSFLGSDVHLFSIVIGLSGMAIITYVNVVGSRSSGIFQEWMTFGLLVVAALFTTAGLFAGDFANLSPAVIRLETGAIAWSGFFAVLASTPFWFAGFDVIPQALGERSENADLGKLPRVVIASLTLALAFYVLVILAATLSMPRDELLAADLLPATAMSTALGSEWWGRLVLLGGLLGLISTWNAMFFSATRIVYALARARMVTPALARVHVAYRTPHASILFVGIIGGFLSLFGRNAIVPIVNIGAAIMSLLFFVICLGLLRLRRSAPDAPRPYRAPGGAILPVVACTFSLGMFAISMLQPVWGTWRVPMEWIVIAVWSVLGAILWRGARDVRTSITEEQREARILEQ